MPLTKLQRKSIYDMVQEIAYAKALSWPNFPVPEKMVMGSKVVHGWTYNAYRMCVDEIWQSHIVSFGVDPSKHQDACGSRTIHPLWDTPEKAAMAMIHELAREAAAKLAIAYEKAGIKLCVVPEELGEKL